jgi:hypothetical protein
MRLKNKFTLPYIVGSALIVLFYVMFIISSIAGKVTMDGMTFWTATSSIGSIFIIIIAIQPILREKKLRELQYSGGLQIAMTKDATIVLVNKTDEPLETIKINQKIYSGECLKEHLRDM